MTVNCWQKKTPKHVESLKIIYNRAVNECPVYRCVSCKIMKDISDKIFLDNAYLPFLHLLTQAVIFIRANFTYT